jgi:ribosomal protein S19
MKTFRLPRKTKKVLKKLILDGKDPNWKTRECKITGIKKHSRYSHISPTYKGITVSSYELNAN